MKLRTVVPAIAVTLMLSSCSGSDQATPVATVSSKWTQGEVGYLQEIYVQIGKTMCQGFTEGKQSDELLVLLAATAKENGLPINDRKVFGPTILAASVAYLCPENLEKVVVQ